MAFTRRALARIFQFYHPPAWTEHYRQPARAVFITSWLVSGGIWGTAAMNAYHDINRYVPVAPTLEKVKIATQEANKKTFVSPIPPKPTEPAKAVETVTTFYGNMPVYALLLMTNEIIGWGCAFVWMGGSLRSWQRQQDGRPPLPESPRRAFRLGGKAPSP